MLILTLFIQTYSLKKYDTLNFMFPFFFRFLKRRRRNKRIKVSSTLESQLQGNSYKLKHNHMKVHKKISNVKRCESCSYETKSKKTMEQHVASHKILQGKKLKCQYCSYETPYPSRLNRHVDSHERINAMCDFMKFEIQQYEAPKLKCQYCSYETPYASRLKRHIDSHKRTIALCDFMKMSCEKK